MGSRFPSKTEEWKVTSGSLVAEDLSFSYAQAEVLRDIRLCVGQGEFVCLLGPSGSGKTTLLRLLAGLETPSAGRVLWNGAPVEGPGIDRGVVFQDYSLYPWMTLADNVALALEKSAPKAGKRERRALAAEYLALVGLQGAERRYPFQLSGGMQQRGAIARALALGSPVLLMDEPFGALDPLNRARLQDLLIAIWSGAQPKKTVVFVTHDVEEALLLGDRVVVLGSSPGRVIADIPVPFPRPRRRLEVFGTPDYHRLSGIVADLYHADVLDRLTAGSAVQSPAEGI